MKKQKFEVATDEDLNVVKNIIYTIRGRQMMLEYKLLENDRRFDELYDELHKSKKEEFKQKIFFKGQIYDAYSLIIDIIQSAKDEIVVIDNFADNSLLKMLAKKNENVVATIVTANNSPIRKIDIRKFNLQYPKLTLKYAKQFHDRFIIIDNHELYHIGASLKDLGNKCFGITKIEEPNILGEVLKQVS